MCRRALHGFCCRMSSVEMSFNIFFVSVTIIPSSSHGLFCSCHTQCKNPILCIHPIISYLKTLTCTAPSVLEFLFFSSLSSCLLLPQNSTHIISSQKSPLTLPRCSHGSPYILLPFLKPVFAEHLLRAKHWVRHITSINLIFMTIL